MTTPRHSDEYKSFLGTLILGGTPPDTWLPIALEALSARFGAAGAWVGLITPGQPGFETIASMHTGPVPALTPAQWDLTAAARAAGQGTGMRTDPAKGLQPGALPVFAGNAQEMIAPIFLNHHPIGAVLLLARHGKGWSLEQLDALGADTAHLAALLDQVWTRDRLERRAAHYKALVGLGQQIAARQDMAQILQSASSEARALLQCDTVAIYQATDDARTLRLSGSTAPDTLPPLPADLHADWSFAGSCLRLRRCMETEDIARTDEAFYADTLSPSRLHSVLAAPICSGNVPQGVLLVGHRTIHRFSVDERSTTEILAGHLAVALANARLQARVFEQENLLRKQERLGTLGLLSAEIAHEIRNPLTVVKLLQKSLVPSFPAGDPRAEDARVLDEKLRQLEDIVTRVLAFGRSQESLHAACSLRQVVDDSTRLMQLKLAQGGVTLEVLGDGMDCVLTLDKAQIQQVLLNLLFNALDAMPAGGRITMGADRVHEDDGSFVRLYIEDTGHGIPHAQVPKLFTGLFSAKPTGNGLGLAICKRILRAHNGNIRLARTSPAGTRMEILLPIG